MFATKSIAPGTIIVRDKIALHLMRPHIGQSTSDQVQQAFSRLNAKDQKKFLQLHEGHRAFDTKLLRIYKANAFSNDDSSCHIYPNISNINHSCVPNAELEPGDDSNSGLKAVRATQQISKGEEVFISKPFPKICSPSSQLTVKTIPEHV